MSLVPYVHLDVTLAGLRAGTTLTVPTDTAHHLTKVLRLGPGASIELADGVGWQAPAQLGEGSVTLGRDATHVPPPAPALVVAQALAKGRKLDEVVRQVTELGADGFVALRTARSVGSLDAARQGKVTARWRQVAWAASEQARRPTRPVIGDPIPLEALLDRTRNADAADDDDADHAAEHARDHATDHATAHDAGLVLVAQPGGQPLPTVLAQRPTPVVVTIAIGPEGGFDDGEVARLEAGGAHRVGLGPSVLRTEHAAAAAVAACAALLGRWG